MAKVLIVKFINDLELLNESSVSAASNVAEGRVQAGSTSSTSPQGVVPLAKATARIITPHLNYE
jgi:hypothetical protein